MADKKLRRQLYEHLCARIRGETDVEATKSLILDTQTADRGYWIVVEQAQSLLPPSGPPEKMPPESSRLLARCMIFLRTDQNYQWEKDDQGPGNNAAGSPAGGRNDGPATPAGDGMIAAVFVPAAGLGAAALLVWTLMGRQWIVQFYTLTVLAILWLLLGYKRYRRRITPPPGDVAAWPFYDHASYETYRQTFAPLLAADTAGILTLEPSESPVPEAADSASDADNTSAADNANNAPGDSANGAE